MFEKYNIVHEDMRSLSDQEEQTFNRFISLLQHSSCKFVYRGEQRIKDMYCCDDMTEFLHKVFLIGVKGEHFWKQRSKYITKTIGKKNYMLLFKEYNKLFSREDIDSVRTKNHLESFKRTNKDFCDFFLNLNNSELLWDIVKNQSPQERGMILDYYIAVLHGVGHIAINGSYMISTSTEFKVAQKYQKDGTIFVSWINQQTELTPHYDINKNNTYIKSLNLPTCSNSVFPEDYEICVSYGLLPQKIIGVIHKEEFYVNKNMFNNERTLDDILIMGFYIDQKPFKEVLKMTKYKRAFDVLLNYYGFDYELWDV